MLNQAHSFTVSVVATDQHHNNVTGAGVALPQTDTFGYFSLPTLTNNPSNPEVFVKILDGLAVNGNYWIFYGHLTDLIYDLTVTDNVTQSTKTYHKDAGNQPGGFDTTSFPGAASTTTARKSAPGALPDAYIRTSVDISNNTTTDGVNAVMQYCYAVNDAFQGCTNQITVSLGHLDNFHSDDIVGYLAGQGVLAPGAQDNSLGTLLVTFTNLPSSDGWEGSVTASTYNRVSEVDPLRGTVGCGQLASLFFDSATTSLVGTAHDTVPAPSLQAGSLGAILGIHNTDAARNAAARDGGRQPLRRRHRSARRQPDHALGHPARRAAPDQRPLRAGGGADQRHLGHRLRRYAQHDAERADDRGVRPDAGHRQRRHPLQRSALLRRLLLSRQPTLRSGSRRATLLRR